MVDPVEVLSGTFLQAEVGWETMWGTVEQVIIPILQTHDTLQFIAMISKSTNTADLSLGQCLFLFQG
jgi:hypothetical protein